VLVAVREASDRLELRVENDTATPYEASADAAFDRFYRGSNSGSVPGVGLGLTIARRIVEKLGGELQMSSLHDGRRMQVSLRFPEREPA
jgi:two-component system OmpR family sensor kinase